MNKLLMQDNNIGKIYSRKRFIISRNGNFGKNYSIKNKNRGQYKKYANNGLEKKKKIIKLIILITIIIVVSKMFLNYFEPIFQTLCEEKVKSLATIITNQQSTKIMNKYQYDDLYNIGKDENGNVVIIKSNVVPINNLISDLTENIQHEFENLQNIKIKLPVGSLTGIYFLSGFGPDIPINVSIAGTLDVNIKSEFIAQGINQTLHRVYVDFECEMKIVTPGKSFSQKVTNQVIIAEHIIIGNIPSSYYNLDGFESANDTMQIIK